MSTSSSESSGQFITSCSRILNTYVQDLIESIAHGVVSDRTSVFGFEPSPVASVFFIIFHGAMIFKIERGYMIAKELRELLTQIKLTTL
jgi:hypothetical protein